MNTTQEEQQALPRKVAQPEVAREALAEKDTNSSSKTGEGDTLDLIKDDTTVGKPASPTVDLTKEATPSKSCPAAGSKRKSPPLSDDDDNDEEGSNLDDFEIPPGATLDSADVVRNKINRFIESGEMKVKDFVAAIDVTSTGYHRFMTQHGREKGMQSNCYIQAWKFFEKRKAAGLKMPTKKKAKTDADASKSPTSTKKGAKKDEGIPDLSDIHLDGEDADGVEVYDTATRSAAKSVLFCESLALRKLHSAVLFSSKCMPVASPQVFGLIRCLLSVERKARVRALR